MLVCWQEFVYELDWCGSWTLQKCIIYMLKRDIVGDRCLYFCVDGQTEGTIGSCFKTVCLLLWDCPEPVCSSQRLFSDWSSIGDTVGKEPIHWALMNFVAMDSDLFSWSFSLPNKLEHLPLTHWFSFGIVSRNVYAIYQVTGAILISCVYISNWTSYQPTRLL